MAQVDIVVTTKGVDKADPTKPANSGQSANAPVEALNQGTSGKNLISASVYANQIIGLGKQALVSSFNFAKSKYGDFTGDYIGQTKIDNAFGLAQTLGSIATSIGSGAMAGGVFGAITGAIVSVGSLAISSAQTNYNYSMGIIKTNAQASFNSARLGDILVNGNRG